MIRHMFSVYDNKAQAFCNPFFMENKATAIRSFTYAANDKTIDIGKYPEDYTLFYMGEFNDADASLQTIQPTAIAYALALSNRNQDETEVTDNVA